MALCLAHPEHGYYRRRDPLGTSGDFTTAPEISQMFGELLGAWSLIAWKTIGAPSAFALVELGPGRGTLMADALRATARAADFHAALSLHLVETSPVLREKQQQALGPYGPVWHDSIDTLPALPTIILANEFFDCLPVRQFLRTQSGWAERCVGLAADGETLAWTVSPRGALAAALLPRTAAPGAIAELNLAAGTAMRALAQHILAHDGTLLAIDYGYTQGYGDTLQALRNHRFVDPLAAPGDCDLTAHVDFAALVRAAEEAGAAAHGPVEQGAFLATLGIELRAAALLRAQPQAKEMIEAALKRLTDPEEMGRLFKVLALTRRGQASPAGFEIEAEEFDAHEP
jgi:SAM-dependent MidA family methyltransferase